MTTTDDHDIHRVANRLARERGFTPVPGDPLVGVYVHQRVTWDGSALTLRVLRALVAATAHAGDDVAVEITAVDPDGRHLGLAVDVPPTTDDERNRRG